jgi:hemoglobin
VIETARTPTLYEWIGGLEALNRSTKRFYEHVNQDQLLQPVFAHMDAAHSQHVAAFLPEVLGGPTTFSSSAVDIRS